MDQRIPEEDHLRVALGLNEFCQNLDGWITSQPLCATRQPHRREMHLKLIRALDALDKIAQEQGFIVTAERKVHTTQHGPHRYTDLDVRENVHWKPGMTRATD